MGREMISEVLPISDKMSTMIANSVSKDELEKQAALEGFFSMFQDGLQKAREGKTTVEEIIRVARS
jgi:general secretion pathway protein E